MMALVRVYTKRIGSKPDFDQPVVLTKDRGGTNVEALCGQIHKTLAKEFKYGLVWGTSSKHVSGQSSLVLMGNLGGQSLRYCLSIPSFSLFTWTSIACLQYPQRCGLTHQLEDEDVVQIVKKKVISHLLAWFRLV